MVRAFVNTVLGFLDVDDNTRTSVLDVLVPSLERDGITGEHVVYERVTEWIDRRSAPWRQRERDSR